MAVIRVERVIDGHKVVFAVNLTRHPGDVLQMPEELKKERFHTVVNETGTEIHLHAVEAQAIFFRAPEHELLHKLIDVPPYALEKHLRDTLSPSEFIDFQVMNRIDFMAGSEGEPSEFHDLLKARGLDKVLDTQVQRMIWRNSAAALALDLAAAVSGVAAFRPGIRWIKEPSAVNRRKFLGRALLSLTLVSGAGGIVEVSPARKTNLSGRKTASSRDIEVLKSKIEDALFPTLLITGRSAVIADGAVDAAKGVIKILREDPAKALNRTMHEEVVREINKTGPEIKVLVNAGAGHANIVNFLRNDTLRRRKVDWYVKNIKSSMDSAFREALKEKKQILLQGHYPMEKLHMMEAGHLRSKDALKKRYNGEALSNREFLLELQQYQRFVEEINKAKGKRETSLTPKRRYTRRELFRKFALNRVPKRRA